MSGADDEDGGGGGPRLGLLSGSDSERNLQSHRPVTSSWSSGACPGTARRCPERITRPRTTTTQERTRR